jgi:RimJ/RimL family protein N-acetyltransferase
MSLFKRVRGSAGESNFTKRGPPANCWLALAAEVELRSVREEARMTDPSVGMKSFQKELRRGGIAIQVAKTDPNLFVHRDAPNGPPEIRFTYVRLKGKTVTAMVIFSAEPPIDGKPSFAVGYAVPKAFQKQGRAKEVLVAAIADMRAGLSRNGFPEFYIEAIVGADNVASRKIAEQVISDEPEAITEGLSGLLAFKYVRRITS